MNVKMKNSGQIDDLVQYVTLHRPRPVLLNGSVFPFIVIFGVWLYLWVFVYGLDSEAHYEAFLVILVVIACVQILVCLCCFWSVHIQTFLNCKKVSHVVYYLNIHAMRMR